MIGGLVEDQNIGFGQEEPDQHDLALFASGKFTKFSCLVTLGEPEAREHPVIELFIVITVPGIPVSSRLTGHHCFQNCLLKGFVRIPGKSLIHHPRRKSP